MFDCKEGFVHFLMADEGKYTLPSLRQVSLSEYLDFLLSERQYRSVWIAEGMDPYGLTAYGKGAVSALESSVKNRWGHSFAVVQKNPSGLCGTVQLKAAEFCKVILKLLSGKNGALVLPVEILSRLAQQDHGLACQLIQNEAAYSSRRNILILRGVTPANENMRCFWNPPFTRLPDGSCLLPELTQILENTERISFYIHFKHSMGNRFQIFQYLDPKTIEFLIRRVMLLHPDRVLPETEIRDLTALIHAELYNQDDGKDIPHPVFRELCTREALERKLEEISTWNKLLSELADFQSHAGGQPVSEYLQSHYPVSPDAALKHTLAQDPVTKNLHALCIPQGYPEEHQGFCQKFNQMQKFYSIVWNVQCPDCVQAKILSAIQYLRTGLELGFFPLADKCVELITTYVCYNRLDEGTLDKVYSRINHILKNQQNISRYEHLIDIEQNNQEIHKKRLSKDEQEVRNSGSPSSHSIYLLDGYKKDINAREKVISRFKYLVDEYKRLNSNQEKLILMNSIVPEFPNDHIAQEFQDKMEENDQTLSRMIQDNDLCELATSEPRHIQEEVHYTEEELDAKLLEIQKELGVLTI